MRNIDMNKFKPYIVIDDAIQSNAEVYSSYYKTAEEANSAAQDLWEGLTACDRRGNRRVYVRYITLNEMNLDWLDDDDEFDYNNPPWNGDWNYDPNDAMLFDSRFYQQKIDAVEYLRIFDINTEMWDYYHVFEEPELEGDYYTARAIYEDDNPVPDTYDRTAFMKTYRLKWNKEAYDNGNPKPLEITPLEQTVWLDELLHV